MHGVALWLLLASRQAPSKAPAFAKTVQPILEAHCKPCHFSGGRMYDSLPFDRAQTVVKLNTKLFTRIKDENERAVIRRFLGLH